MPTVLPIDVTAIVAIIMGMLVVLIPIAGLTARFALKPLVESLGNLMNTRTVEDTVAITERRVALLEQQVESLEHTLREYEDKRSFDQALAAGRDAAALPEGSGPGPA